jgi:pantoate--beta-alanine ligase
MGALHNGHVSLVEQSASQCKHTVVSIFVNPTQFNNQNDLATYPRTLEADCELLAKHGADIIFAPSVKDIYPIPDNRIFELDGLDSYGEGPRRPGHFNGVVQVVSRLFDIVKPTKAFFGEKDFQQLAILKHMTAKLGYNIQIIGCPIIRDEDGLARSSRNMLLTPAQRKAAPHIYATISKAGDLIKKHTPAKVIEILTKEINSNKELNTEYIELVDSKTLKPIENWDNANDIRLWCAVFAGTVRLIDNIAVK